MFIAPGAIFVFVMIGIVFAMIVLTALGHRRHTESTMMRLCRHCGENHPAHARYCRRCGAKLD